MTKRLVRPGDVRRVAMQVLVGNSVVGGVTALDVQRNSHYQADTWKATLALNAPDGRTLDWWAADERVGDLFTLQASLDGGTVWTTLVVGEADKIALDVVQGTIQANGRDLTRRFLDNRTQELFQNKSSSEVIELLAARRGLTADVTPTTTLIDRYYQQDHTVNTAHQLGQLSTEWDLMHTLAQKEGFDLYVEGTTLHSHPATDPTKTEPFVVTWNQVRRTGDVVGLTVDRSLTLAKGVIVKVQTWNSRQGRGFTRTSPTGAKPSTDGTKSVQQFVLTRPNLSEDQAQKLADTYREEITRHERTGSLTIPAELDLTPRDMLRIEGVGGGWDQLYFVSSIDRSFGYGGATQTIEFKNHSPETETAAL